MSQPHAVVTGAFSNIGAATAATLLDRGWRVTTLTNRAPAPGDDARIARSALRFDDDHLARVLDGADAFVNTYWIRFAHRETTFRDAIVRSGQLIAAAQRAGVGRFVHVSVSNPTVDSPLGYYAGKALVERDLFSSGVPWSIVRPTLVVGPRDVLTNNIAWFVRRSPLVAIPTGSGYRLQPVLLDDVAELLADRAEGAGEGTTIDAAGPDVLTFAEYVRVLARALGRPARLLRVPPVVMLGALGLAGVALRDTVLTREELAGLRDELLVSHAAPTGTRSVVDWLEANGRGFGAGYVNDTIQRFATVP
jgi:NADH dehydrogenase